MSHATVEGAFWVEGSCLHGIWVRVFPQFCSRLAVRHEGWPGKKMKKKHDGLGKNGWPGAAGGVGWFVRGCYPIYLLPLTVYQLPGFRGDVFDGGHGGLPWLVTTQQLGAGGWPVWSVVWHERRAHVAGCSWVGVASGDAAWHVCHGGCLSVHALSFCHSVWHGCRSVLHFMVGFSLCGAVPSWCRRQRSQGLVSLLLPTGPLPLTSYRVNKMKKKRS